MIAFLMLPAGATAQVTHTSTNFEIDSVNFGSNLVLTSGQASIPPSISSEGPIIEELNPTTARIVWETDKKSSSTVEYGKTTNYGFEVGNAELVTEHVVTLLGLEQETTYHFRVKSVDAFGGESFSEDKSFTTPAEAGIASIRITDVGYDKALISWTTGLFTTSRLEYGTSTSYGKSQETTSRGFLTKHIVQLTDLSPGTDYHFRIVAEDEKGAVTRSSDLIFTTIANPIFTSVSAKASSSANEMIINWKTNVFTSGIVNYKSEKDGSSLTAGDANLTDTHELSLKNLFGLTAYVYTITATDAQGKQVTTAPQTFTTPSDTSPPQVSELKVNVTRSGETLVLTASWKTNEPAKSKVVYNPKTNAEQVTDLPESTGYLTEHIIVSSGVIPSTPYTLRVTVTDPFGNQSEESINFVTPGLRKSILQLILDSILKPFGWLSRVVEN